MTLISPFVVYLLLVFALRFNRKGFFRIKGIIPITLVGTNTVDIGEVQRVISIVDYPQADIPVLIIVPGASGNDSDGPIIGTSTALKLIIGQVPTVIVGGIKKSGWKQPDIWVVCIFC